MIPFITALPFATKLAIITIAFTATFGFGMYLGNKIGASRCHETVIEAQKLGMEIAERQTVVSEKVVTKYVDRIKIVHEKSQEINNAIPNFIKSDHDTYLSGGFRVWHDAAVAGEVPDPARIADAPIVETGIVATTIGINYDLFHKNKQQLDSLQDWVREQADVK